MNVRLALMAAITTIATSTVTAQSIVPVLPPNKLPPVSPIQVEKFGVNPAGRLSLDWKAPDSVEITSSTSGAATLLILGLTRIDVVIDPTTRLFVSPQLVLVLPGVTPNQGQRVSLPGDRLVPSMPVYAQAVSVGLDPRRLTTMTSNGLKIELQGLTIGG